MIDKFGTHFISEITLGSKYLALHTISLDSYRNFFNEEFDIL
jgi:hypothetical protein